MKDNGQRSWSTIAVFVGALAVAATMVAGTWWVGQSAKQANEEAVHTISTFYLDELANRRQQVVAESLDTNVRNIETAVGLLTPDDLQDLEHLQAFQARMKEVYELEKFAFVDENGLIYTSQGTQDNIADYPFDYQTLSKPEIAVKDQNSEDKKVIIAIPLSNVTFMDKELKVCFMEMDMHHMVENLSMLEHNEATFCNLYAADGTALADVVLGGLGGSTNLFDALDDAVMEPGRTVDDIRKDFATGSSGVVSFTLKDVYETLDYVPVEGTDWMLTYLIRESVIGERTSAYTDGIVARSLQQTAITALVLAVVFAAAFAQNRRSTRIALEHETEQAQARVKQEEMERRLALQEELLEQEQQRVEQDRMITALSSDYRSVYYVDLDVDEGVCYRATSEAKSGIAQGEHFVFSERLGAYAEDHVTQAYREGFLNFIDPGNIRAALATQVIIAYRYLACHDGQEAYEMLRMAGVRHAEDREDGIVHAVGIGFSDVDAETRDSMAKNQALADALQVAEDASRAKTAFLSNMSHEIRTPMNAIIGLSNIALHDPALTPEARDHLEKIDGSAKHLLGLINDVLDVSRIESGRMTLASEPFSFAELLEQVNTIVSGQCDDKGLGYNCHITGEVAPRYIGDAMKLRQVLINILGNSVKFTPEGGEVELGVERISQFDGKSSLRFTLSDTGIGMDEAFVPKLFDTFTQEDSSRTNKYGSTGLGMAITKSIVEMMNGTIEVRTKKGEGTTFVVTVTLLDVEDDEADVSLPSKKLNVLVIDDDPMSCEHAKIVLEGAGVSAQVASSGAEAVEMVRLRHARRDPFDLILVDWRMPEMDGVETTRRIREIVGHESAIIILTAYNWDDVYEAASEAGVDSFIAKPLFAANVLDQFKQALKRKGLLAKKEERRADLAGRRLLVAEDVEINAEIIMALMEMRDASCEHAENGRIAVEMFAAHEPGYYDAVIMDMRMPEMDGLTATATIRAMDRDDAKRIPIIALTANAFDEDVELSLQAGLNAHLSKPVDPDQLYETLETLIED